MSSKPAILVVVTTPAVALARDDELENPNACRHVFTGEDVPPGTVIMTPPGFPMPPGAPGPFNPDGNGGFRQNHYVCVGGRWVLVASALEVGALLAADALAAGDATVKLSNPGGDGDDGTQLVTITAAGHVAPPVDDDLELTVPEGSPGSLFTAQKDVGEARISVALELR